MTRFAIGDVAIIRSLADIEPEWRGRECTILSHLVHLHGVDGARYRIDIQGVAPRTGSAFYARPYALKPLPPPDTRSTWSEGVWQPKGLRNVIDFDALLRTTE